MTYGHCFWNGCRPESGLRFLAFSEMWRQHSPCTQPVFQVIIQQFCTRNVQSHTVRLSERSTITCPVWCFGQGCSADRHPHLIHFSMRLLMKRQGVTSWSCPGATILEPPQWSNSLALIETESDVESDTNTSSVFHDRKLLLQTGKCVAIL